MRTRFVAMLMGVFLLASIGGVQAARPRPAAPDATCWLDPAPMTAGQTANLFATGLPTKIALNVFVVDGGETYGFPVGIHDDGKLEYLWVTPRHAGTLQVTVTGPERGQTKVYASCTGEVAPAG